MSETEYISLLHNAATKWPQVKHVLQYHHREATEAEIEDAFDAALIVFSDKEKIVKIEHPEKPFRWLLSTAERMYLKDRRKKHGNIPIEQIAVEPLERDRGMERYEASDLTKAVFAMVHENYAKILRLVLWEGYSFEEIAEQEGKSVGTIYDRFERAKKKAKEALRELDILPKAPPAIRIPMMIKTNLKNNG
ncbi:MAG TPA: sigma-70 family RNA polymerase sigma factor, partial [Candidatus Kapabacteria bacterium]